MGENRAVPRIRRMRGTTKCRIRFHTAFIVVFQRLTLFHAFLTPQGPATIVRATFGMCDRRKFLGFLGILDE
jgi:hypothetical protein